MSLRVLFGPRGIVDRLVEDQEVAEGYLSEDLGKFWSSDISNSENVVIWQV